MSATTAAQAYRNLSKVADSIGGNNYHRQLAEHLRSGRRRSTFRFTVTDAHRRVVDAMGEVMRGTLTPEQAMAVIHEYEVNEQRFGDAA